MGISISRGHPIGLNSNCGGGSNNMRSLYRLACEMYSCSYNTGVVQMCLCMCCMCVLLSVAHSPCIISNVHSHSMSSEISVYWVSRLTENYYLIGKRLCLVPLTLSLRNHPLVPSFKAPRHFPSQFLVKSFSHYLTICLIFMFFASRTLHTFLTLCRTHHTTFTASC